MTPAGTRVTLLGFTVPDDRMAEVLTQDPEMPTQTHAFAWSLVQALGSAGYQVTLLSAMPVSVYPGNRSIRFASGWFRAHGVEGYLLGFVNVLGARHVTRFLSACRVGLMALTRWRTEILLVHGVHSPFLWFGVLAARVCALTIVPVLTDPPGVVRPRDTAVTRLLRKLDVALVRQALRHCDGVVALTEALARDFAPGRDYLVMEGILADRRPTPGPRTVRGDTLTIAYAGGLTRAYGVDRLVEAVRGMDDARVRLRVFGRGELDGWIRGQAERDPRILNPQFLGREELTRQLGHADVLVNPRPVDQALVRYSFPSKLLEYLSSGVPVVSTRLPGIPASYEGRLAFAESDTVEGLRSAIIQVLAMPRGEAAALGAAGAEFVRAFCGVAVQGGRLGSFLSTLEGNRAPDRAFLSEGNA